MRIALLHLIRSSIFCILALLVIIASLAAPSGWVSSAAAQITNGDFEDGPTGWSMPIPSPGLNVSIYDANCGEGIQAEFASSLDNSGGQACIAQDFECGAEGSDGICTITFDYRFNIISADLLSSRLLVSVDGEQLLSVSPSGEWTTGAVDVPCGSHFLTFCLDVDPDDNAWTACVDNVTALCTGVVSSDTSRWGTLKALFR